MWSFLSEVIPTLPPPTTTATTVDKSTINNKSELLTMNDKKVSSGSKLTTEGSLEDDEIEEEMDDFLNSSVSASEDFTKDETASEAASLKADFVEKLPWYAKFVISEDLISIAKSKMTVQSSLAK